MKKIIICLLLSCIFGAAQAQKNKKKKKGDAEAAAVVAQPVDSAKLKPQAEEFVLTNTKDSASYALGIIQGKRFRENGADTLFNLGILHRAMMVAMRGDSVKMADDEMMAIINMYVAGEQAKRAEANRKAGEKFLAENKTKPGVKVTPSGLQYQVIKEGNGVKPKATDVVQVHYTGTLMNGKTFDSSYERNEPAEFPVNGVISGWTEGLQLMSEGAKYKLFIPSELGYGEQGVPSAGIDPGAVLLFEVELLKIVKKEAPKSTKPVAKPKPAAKPQPKK